MINAFQKIFGCTSHSSGVLYLGGGTVTFELITPKDLYNTNNKFLLKVKSFRNCYIFFFNNLTIK